ncbi:ATP-dependent DNA helicase RecG [gut metagenome]|uniref:ATP-dependent DNA helicase RecG n=1 Tax=gut metagenome TaxID=749906 RepID=J9FP43_9ZZZZ
MDILSQDVKYLKGVGPNRAKLLLDELQVATVRDLLYVLPYKYVDRTVIHTISQLVDGMPYVQLKGKLVDFETEGEGRKRRLKAVFTDGTGYLDLVWFNGIKHLETNLKVNQFYLILGKPSAFNGRMSIVHPEMEKPEDVQLAGLTLQPHYHTTDKMKRSAFTSRLISDLVQNAFDRLPAVLSETLPDYLIRQFDLMPLGEALRIVHHPPSSEALPKALHRLKFEELFYLQLDILRYSHNRKLNQQGFVFSTVGEAFLTFYHQQLPFELTNAQKRVVKEIRRDMGIGRQMNRLLQGDVGSGKTMVALMCCLIAADNGYQSCIMAPTEILAEQHLATLRKFLGPMPVRVELLTGTVTGKARREILEAVANGEVHILVGTHALIEPSVVFRNLGLAVIDEQHRFGVKQRAKLWEKNIRPPHVLVMTATPIPRTLAMTVYGDLDVSVIDELPPGRKPIQTLHYYEQDRARLFEGIHHQLRLGRQVYVVYPLIEESETMDLKNLEEGMQQMVAAFPQYRIGKVHGKMKPAEKDEAMRAFANCTTQILVSTTVIEVGVNVPNASVMVIEESQRFGLSQLHQLRGRVGRGAEQSYCILVTPKKLSETTRRRMQIMVDTTDGFEIAEEDLKLRGPGDLEGTAQSGMPFQLKVANLVKDAQLMQQARDAAAAILQNDPYEQMPQNAVLWSQLRVLKKQKTNFSAIS